jgi:chromosome segregation and condensation protein ScpB
MSLDLKTIIEGLLFVAEEPLTMERISMVTEGAAPDRIQKTLDELESEYEDLGRPLSCAGWPVATSSGQGRNCRPTSCG